LLHPDRLETLARQMVNAARTSQLWVAAHSTKLAELVEKHSGESCLQPHNGGMRVVGQKLLDVSEEPG
jgi:predicted ATPase